MLNKFQTICAAVAVLGMVAPLRAAPAMNEPANVTLNYYRDPWPAGRQRWWDISGNSAATRQPFASFLDGSQTFSYRNRYPNNPDRLSRVTVTYDKNPATSYFVGHISAKGLKPNFAYQLKLVGKPVYGARGMGKASSYITVDSRLPGGQAVLNTVNDGQGNPTPINGDDWANQQLGYAGRWWDDTTQSAGTNNPDSYYQNNYPANTIYGYLFLGDFVTDQYGRANMNFTGRYSYHITRASWENPYLPALREDPRSPFTIVTSASPPPATYGYTTPPFYGYGHDFTSKSVRLYYEYEPGRPQPVSLASGTYHCRLVITEESFHNNVWSEPSGGYWKSILASEDFSYDASNKLIGADSDPANDLVFTIG